MRFLIMFVLVGAATLSFGGPTSHHGPWGSYMYIRCREPTGQFWELGPAESYMAWSCWFDRNREVILADHIGTRRSGRMIAKDERQLSLMALVRACGHPAPFVRGEAALALGRIGGIEAVRRLTRMAAEGDSDQDVGIAVMLALGLAGGEASVRGILAAMRSPERQAAAVLALALTADPVGAGLLGLFGEAALRRGEDDFLSSVAVAQAIAGEGAAVTRIYSSKDVRQWSLPERAACWALARCESLDNSRLRFAARDRIPGRDQIVAIKALSVFPRVADAEFMLGEPGVRRVEVNETTRILGLVGIAQLPGCPVDLRGRILEELREPAFRENGGEDAAFAAFGLLQLEPDEGKAVDAARELLGRPNDNLGAAVMIALATRGMRELNPCLRRVVGDRGSPVLRCHAALALGILGDHDNGPVLRALVGNADENQEVRRLACFGLGFLGEPESAPVLLEALDGAGELDLFGRGAAAASLGLLGAGSAVGRLLSILETGRDPISQALAALALGWLFDRDDTPRLPLQLRGADLTRVGTVERAFRIL